MVGCLSHRGRRGLAAPPAVSGDGLARRKLAEQAGATRAPRRIKDLVEEVLFECRRSLLSDLSVVLFDTTSLMFYGAGGETLGRHGKSKNHRPDLRPDLR